MNLLTVPEVAEILGVRIPRAYELVREGVIPAVRLGRQRRIDPRALRAWINRGGQGLKELSDRSEAV